jgi:hypothetical protein
MEKGLQLGLHSRGLHSRGCACGQSSPAFQGCRILCQSPGATPWTLIRGLKQQNCFLSASGSQRSKGQLWQGQLLQDREGIYHRLPSLQLLVARDSVPACVLSPLHDHLIPRSSFRPPRPSAKSHSACEAPDSISPRFTDGETEAPAAMKWPPAVELATDAEGWSPVTHGWGPWC